MASMRTKCAQDVHQSITFQTTSSTCSYLYSFLPNWIENLSCWTSGSQELTKGRRVGGSRGAELDFKMEADHG